MLHRTNADAIRPISAASWALLQQRLYAGEQIVWTGRPDVNYQHQPGIRTCLALAKLSLPAFLVGWVLGAIYKDPALSLLMPICVFLCLILIGVASATRKMPLAHEEYALTNRRAFSIHIGDGFNLIGDVWLDSGTQIKTQRFGGGRTYSLILRRPTVPGKTGKLDLYSMVTFLNLIDVTYPKQVAEWAVADTVYARQFLQQYAA